MFSHLETYGYQRSNMKVSVEAEETEGEYPVTCYHITAVDSVTVFTSDVYADAHNPSNIRRYIDFELVKTTKTGKYISEEIAKEIAVGGLKNFYTVVSCTLAESGELPIYEVVTTTPGGAEKYTNRISAESGMVINIEY